LAGLRKIAKLYGCDRDQSRDIIVGDGDVFGDGVNGAARLEQIAEPGGILISSKVHEEVRGKLPYVFEDRGE